ncbi:hypothetical protein PHLGIDRAFT_238058 [Phlebiopsis gigantea 11061_1 CR5-6]|uniref:Uncharacterized protein n=1 Tax=Phlebiopsis gigantea (strain 11061_1 CR5-6) TaxID=745531 RepID=A0A0C3S1X9_PHLG1|nr:hypothetical protein PHLGIDRAFT_238058 [Phlebiopsis gigantea 11061_1 CR5-6]
MSGLNRWSVSCDPPFTTPYPQHRRFPFVYPLPLYRELIPEPPGCATKHATSHVPRTTRVVYAYKCTRHLRCDSHGPR